MIYLDHAATTHANPQALQAALPYLTVEFANPSSQYEIGLKAKASLTRARETVAKILNVRASEITFTSGGTESNNLAIKGIALANPRGKHLISARTEHESVLQTLEFLERIHGFEVEYLAVDEQGRIKPEQLEQAIRPDTTLVTLMLVNNENGTIHPIAKFAEIAKQHRVPFHTDAVQAPNWLELDVQKLGVTSLSLSGHKFGAPKGVGVLFHKSSVAIEPLIHGGGQEEGLRSGTENVAFAVAFAEALRLTEPHPNTNLRDAFITAVTTFIPNAKLTGDKINRHPGIASFTFEGLNGETLLLELENLGVLCSSGSACAAGKDDPSHVLLACGLSEDLARTSVRFSLSPTTTHQEVEQAANALAEAVKRVSNL